MRGLFVKDLELTLQQKKFFAMLLVVGVLLSFTSDGTFAVSYFPFVCAMFVTSTISYDEFENGFSFLMTLPITRRSYVVEKYLYALALIGGAWAAGLAAEFLCLFVQSSGSDIVEVFGASLVMLPIALLIDAVMIPFLLKYGQEKGRYVSLGVMGAVIAVAYLISKAAESRGNSLITLLDALENAGIWRIATVLAAGTAIVYTVSCLISVAIMEKKEF